MKQFKPGHDNKWFLTSALLAALALNSGLSVLRTHNIESEDFSSASPVDLPKPTLPKNFRLGEPKASESKKEEKSAPAVKVDTSKVKTISETPASAEENEDIAIAKDIQKILDAAKANAEKFKTSDPEKHKKLMAEIAATEKNLKEKKAAAEADEKREKAVSKLAEIQKELAKNDLSDASRKDLLKQLSATTSELTGTEGGDGCDAECKKLKSSAAKSSELKALTDLVASLVASKEKDKEETLSESEQDKKRSQDALAKVDKICSKEDEARRLKCYADEFLVVLEKNTGKKQLDANVVKEFYNKNIEEEIRGDLRDVDPKEFRQGSQAVAKLGKSIPSEYNYIRTEIVDASRTSLKETALEVQDLYRKAQYYKSINPSYASQLEYEAMVKNRILHQQTHGLDGLLSTSLSSARKRSLITSRSYEDLLETRWRKQMNPILDGLDSDPYRLSITEKDKEFMELVRSYAASFTDMRTSGQIAGQANAAANISARAQGRNSNLRMDNVGGSNNINNRINSRIAGGTQKMDVRNENVNFGNLGSRTDRSSRGAYTNRAQ